MHRHFREDINWLSSVKLNLKIILITQLSSFYENTKRKQNMFHVSTFTRTRKKFKFL